MSLTVDMRKTRAWCENCQVVHDGYDPSCPRYSPSLDEQLVAATQEGRRRGLEEAARWVGAPNDMLPSGGQNARLRDGLAAGIRSLLATPMPATGGDGDDLG